MKIKDLRVGDRFTFEYTVKSIDLEDGGIEAEANNREVLLFSPDEEVHERTHQAPVPIRVGDFVVYSQNLRGGRYKVLAIHNKLFWIEGMDGNLYTEAVYHLVLDKPSKV